MHFRPRLDGIDQKSILVNHHRMSLRFRILLSSFLAGSNAFAAPIDFETEIRPIIAEKCTLCHGPDDKKGGLRLTGIDFASQKLKSGETAIIPGDVDNSSLVQRTHSTDPDDVMPPPDRSEPLTDSEKAKLKQWIAEGADWPKHWAYDQLQTSKLPSDDVHPIDHFVRQQIDETSAKLNIEKARLEVRPADDITLIRRLFYDLMGRPPTVEQVEDHLPRFQKDRNSAVERLVDDLLASPHFGERWGRHWLDHARYADSDGYEKDRDRPNAWRYRDWVINAINADMPFDQFTIEQFAGDLLEAPTEEQLLATAFNRQTLTNTEGGTDQEQWRVAAVMDRVETLGAVWMGLTVGCARCHTHKYDEITQTEYYQLFAYFNNGDETNKTMSATPEAIKKWEAAQKKHDTDLQKAKADLKTVTAQLKPNLPELIAQTKAILAKAGTEQTFTSLKPGKFTGPKGVTFTHNKTDDSVLVGGTNVASGTYTIEGELPAGTTITGLKLEALTDKSLSRSGPGRSPHGNFVLNQIVFSVDGKSQHFGDAEADFSQGNYPVTGSLDANAKTGKDGTGWAISPQMGTPHQAVFGLVRPLTIDNPAKFTLQLIQNYGSNHMIGKFRISALTSPTPLAVPPELREHFSKQEGLFDDSTLLTRFYAKWDTKATGLVQRIAAIQSKIPPKPSMSIRVLTERTKDRRQTHIFRRGEFKQPTDEVQTGTFSTLPPVKNRGEQGDRLDLARWLVSGENPLPPRVIVNRIWAHLFGTGLVTTINDFGVRGERPSHPGLLDWLAAEFINNGWSRKKLIKTIVMSETYQQSSDHRPELADIDPKNRLLARQNRFRVEAEAIRDISLAAAGLLSDKIGGPSVFPPIPPGVTDQNYNSSFKWNVSPGEDRYRRGMYTYFKRTAPHPNLLTFDCPDSNVTNVERTRSNTPLAALITLNNETFSEAAQALARRILTDQAEGDDAAKITRAFRICLSRAPEKSELERLSSLLAESRAYYRGKPEDATALAGTYIPESGTAEETASWIATVRVILNLDEFLVRS